MEIVVSCRRSGGRPCTSKSSRVSAEEFWTWIHHICPAVMLSWNTVCWMCWNPVTAELISLFLYINLVLESVLTFRVEKLWWCTGTHSWTQSMRICKASLYLNEMTCVCVCVWFPQLLHLQREPPPQPCPCAPSRWRLSWRNSVRTSCFDFHTWRHEEVCV